MCSSEHHHDVKAVDEDVARTESADMVTERRVGNGKKSSGVRPDDTSTWRCCTENDDASFISSCSTQQRVGKATPSKRIRDVNGYRQRAAALCVRRPVGAENNYSCKIIGKTTNLVTSPLSELEILLVSGRGEKDYWVLPGGGVEKEETTEDAVLREFREEAGIQGAVIAVIGEFTDDERYHRTTLFMLSVMEVFEEWEDFQTGRQRRWMVASEALQKIKKSQMTMVKQSLEIAADILSKDSTSSRSD